MKMKLNQQRIDNVTAVLFEKAGGALNNKNEMGIYIDKAEINLPISLKSVGALGKELILIVMLIRDYIKGDYRDVSVKSILMVATVILYFASPIDIIPDFLISVGVLDDVYILKIVLDQVGGELDKYRLWLKRNKGVEITDEDVEDIIEQEIVTELEQIVSPTSTNSELSTSRRSKIEEEEHKFVW